MQDANLDPAFSNTEIADRLRKAGAVFRMVEGEETLIGQTVDALTEEKAVGWFRGGRSSACALWVLDRSLVTRARPNAAAAQSEGQTPRELPPLRTLGVMGTRGRAVRTR